MEFDDRKVAGALLFVGGVQYLFVLENVIVTHKLHARQIQETFSAC